MGNFAPIASLSESVSQSVSQSVNQTINQSIHQSINQSINHWSHNLQWSQPINQISLSANRMLGLIRRICRDISYTMAPKNFIYTFFMVLFHLVLGARYQLGHCLSCSSCNIIHLLYFTIFLYLTYFISFLKCTY